MELVLIILSFVIFLQTECSLFVHNYKEVQHEVLNQTSNRKNRQIDDDRWIWGYVDVPVKKTEDHTARITYMPTTEVPSNPCDPFSPPAPDFSAPGRRISETKCQEYIWQIEVRDKRKKRTQECTAMSSIFDKEDTITEIFEIGGRDALPGEFPHMGALGWKAAVGTWIFKCGSSLISSKFLLTAAHCSKASPRDTTIADVIPKIVRLGDKNIIDIFVNNINPQDQKIIRIIVHPQYAPPRLYYDIALMEIESDLVFHENLQPACLWSSFDVSSLGTEATSTGWGVVETVGRTESPILQAAVLDFINTSTCDSLLRNLCNRNWCGVEDTQLCAGKLAGGVDACQGDSGGPLSVRIDLPQSDQGALHYVVGVTSFGFKCALANTPGIYTRVSTFIDWIEQNVWPQNGN